MTEGPILREGETCWRREQAGRMAVIFRLNLLAALRLLFRVDSQHPPDGCCHQKILVIDDTIAFCGGIDISDGRWDTRAHRDYEPRRANPRGKP